MRSLLDYVADGLLTITSEGPTFSEIDKVLDASNYNITVSVEDGEVVEDVQSENDEHKPNLKQMPRILAHFNEEQFQGKLTKMKHRRHVCCN